MRVLLIHNKQAGEGALTGREMKVALEHAGHQVTVKDTLKKKTRRKLEGQIDVVIAAGGDGTAIGIARALAGTSLPLLPYPLGTANNVAKSVGHEAGLTTLVETLEQGQPQRVDVGVVSGSWGERLFIESAGVGLFADAVDKHIDDDDKEPKTAAARLAELLTDHAPRRVQLLLDGRDFSGDYLLVEVLNFSMFGPNLRLAPDSKPDDGWLDVVLVKEGDRQKLLGYFDALAAGKEAESPKLDVHRARHITLALDDKPLRVDSTLRPKKGRKARSFFADVHVVPQQLTLWTKSDTRA